jgi:hypothetical protein
MLAELQSILDHARQRYRHCTALEILVADPYHSLSRMIRPGVVLYDAQTNEITAYCELASGAGSYTIQVPYGYSPQTIYWVLVHNLLEITGRIAKGWFEPRDKSLIAAKFEDTPMQPMCLSIPQFDAVDRPRNTTFANYGETTPHGLHVKAPQDITLAYNGMTAEERLKGKGLAVHTYRQYIYLAAIRTTQRIRRFLSESR